MEAGVRALFARPWAIEPAHGTAFIESLVGAESARQAGAQPVKRTASAIVVNGDPSVRVLSMVGPMLHKPPAWLAELGMEYVDTLGLADAITAADADPSVKSIKINADTPGGMVGGIHELADAITKSKKPVCVAVDGMLASAGVWAAAGADAITATRSSEIGSIGVYTVRVDRTQAMANAGIKVHLVSSGGVKGGGADGRVTDAMLAEDARIVGQLRDEFVSSISAGRGRDLSARATGQMWLANDAQRIGLIDTITGCESADPVQLQEETMDLSPLAALAAKYPAKACEILNLAAAGKTDGEIALALAEQVKADELAAAKVAAEIATAELAKAADALKAEQDAHAATKAELAKIQATAKDLVVLADAAVDPGPDAKHEGEMTKAKFAALSPTERAVYLQTHPISSITP